MLMLMLLLLELASFGSSEAHLSLETRRKPAETYTRRSWRVSGGPGLGWLWFMLVLHFLVVFISDEMSRLRRLFGKIEIQKFVG